MLVPTEMSCHMEFHGIAALESQEQINYELINAKRKK